MHACMPSPKLRPHGATPGGQLAVRVEPVGVGAEHRRVAVHRVEVDHDLVAARDDLAALELDVVERPPHGHRAGGLEADGLVHAALEERHVGAGPRASAGAASRIAKTASRVRTNAVADVCAPARR